MSHFRSIRMFNVESVKNDQSDPHSLQRTSCSCILTVYFNSTSFCFYSCLHLYVWAISLSDFYHYCFHIFCRFILLVSFLLFNPDGFTGKDNAKCVLFSYNNFIIGVSTRVFHTQLCSSNYYKLLYNLHSILFVSVIPWTTRTIVTFTSSMLLLSLKYAFGLIEHYKQK